jgi:hypothetical protein
LQKRISDLEAELGSMKSSHVTGATIHPSLCDEYTKACADNARLRAALREIAESPDALNWSDCYEIAKEGLKEGE